MLSLAPILFLLTTSPEPLQQNTKPATFFIVRHAERDGSADALTDIGRKRADALRDFMKLQEVRAVYSTQTKRTMDTATPTAKAAHRDVLTYGASPMPGKIWFQDLAKKHAGEAVLIVGHSNTIVPFARGFGAKMEYEVGHNEYQSMFIVSVQPDGSAQAVRINYGPSLGIVPNAPKGRAPVVAPPEPGKVEKPESAVIK